MIKKSGRRRGRYLHNTQLTQEKNIHVLRGIRTPDPKNLEAVGLYLKPHGHRHSVFVFTFGKYL